MEITTDLRVRSKLADQAMEARKGKNPGDPDYDVLLTGPSRVSKMDGRPLAIYLPGALAAEVDAPGVLGILRSLWDPTGSNRGLASAAPRFGTGRTTALGLPARTYGRRISSSIAGAVDPGGQMPYCRLTAWTGRHLAEWEALYPLFRSIAAHLEAHVPDRYAAQLAEAEKTDPAWVVPGTPFTTVTVNHSFATGTHTDRGDLDAGFSTITVLRPAGAFTGGRLVFPQFRLAADLGHGDLILMDAHEWHGNTPMTCSCGLPVKSGPCQSCGAERISIVTYFRTKLTRCGTPAEEHDKAGAYHEEIAQRREARRGQEKKTG
jgi:hypothetical protein